MHAPQNGEIHHDALDPLGLSGYNDVNDAQQMRCRQCTIRHKKALQ